MKLKGGTGSPRYGKTKGGVGSRRTGWGLRPWWTERRQRKGQGRRGGPHTQGQVGEAPLEPPSEELPPLTRSLRHLLFGPQLPTLAPQPAQQPAQSRLCLAAVHTLQV